MLWIFISGLLAVLGGWSSLATKFCADRPLQGESFGWVSGSMGFEFFAVNYGGCLRVTTGSVGLGLSVFPLFRAFSPPLLIPWREIRSVEGKRILFSSYTVIRLRNHWSTIKIRGKAGDHIQKSFARAEK